MTWGIVSRGAPDELRIFEKSYATNGQFWQRIGHKPVFAGKRVLDAGCGHGALAIAAALSGASSVVAVDLRKKSIDFAREIVRTRFAGVQNAIQFIEGSITALGNIGEFDIVMSRDSFEHFSQPTEVLRVLKGVLRNGGRIYAGFSPLYYSPIGHHFEFGPLPPWAHCLLPDSFLRVLAARRTAGFLPASIADIGLNKWTPRMFREMFHDSGMRVVAYSINRSENPLARVFSLVARFPGLERFFTTGIYCVLEKPDIDPERAQEPA